MYDVNGSSDTISRDMKSLLYASTFKHPADGEFAKIKQLMSMDPYPNYDYQNQNQNQQQHDESYRENQSSFFSNLLRQNGGEELTDPVTDSSNHEPEERIFMKYQQQKKSESDARNFLQSTPSSTPTNQEMREQDIRKQVRDLPPSSPATINDLRRVPSLPPSNNSSSSYGYTNQNNLDRASSFRAMDSTSSNLVRQNSTPAGFLSSLAAENGFATMRNGSSSSTLNNHINFSLGSSSSPSRFQPQFAKNELHDSKYSNLKRSRDGVLKMPQNGETGYHTPNLVHQMSLPNTSSEMAVFENFLQFQQESTVPLKTRAKRGFATHPRSIAERVRRTRISERIKRLQELFPDIDKQSNTADMLDMAVEYIKNLQKEMETLNDAKARCKCSSTQLQSI